MINHVADIFERESSDAWYKHEAKELLPEGFKCPQLAGAMSLPKRLTFSTFGLTVARHGRRCSRIISPQNLGSGDRQMFTSKAAINIAAGSTLLC